MLDTRPWILDPKPQTPGTRSKLDPCSTLGPRLHAPHPNAPCPRPSCESKYERDASVRIVRQLHLTAALVT
eukprot:1742036-Rhodomonas_salina.3